MNFEVINIVLKITALMMLFNYWHFSIYMKHCMLFGLGCYHVFYKINCRWRDCTAFKPQCFFHRQHNLFHGGNITSLLGITNVLIPGVITSRVSRRGNIFGSVCVCVCLCVCECLFVLCRLNRWTYGPKI